MSRVINKTRIILLAIITLFFSAFVSQTSLAKSSLSEEDEAMFSQNNILFYEPCDTQSSGGSSSEICGSNKNYAGTQVFTDAQMEAVRHHQPFYEKAAKEYGFPWEILAVLHLREHGLAQDNPSNGQGAYQLYSYTNGGKNGNSFYPAGKISDEEFQRQTNIAAKLVHDSYGSGLDLNSDDGVKKMFFRYNGTADVYIERAKKMGFSNEEANRGEGSPYVMNRYDARRDPNSSQVDGNWVGKYTGDGSYNAGAKDQQWGAFTAYKALTCDGVGAANDSGSDDLDAPDTSDGNVSNDSDITGGAKAISDTAAQLAWPKGTDSSKYHTKEGSGRFPAYANAVEELGLSGHGHTHQPDCGDFVETVVKYSGYDKNYGKTNSYIQKHPELWEFIEWDDGDTSKLRTGDIVYGKGRGSDTGQHWWIVTEIDGKLYRAEASYTKDNWGRITKAVSGTWKKYNHQWIYRAKGGGSSRPSCDAKVEGSKNINATGAALAWPLGTDKDKYTLASGKVLESVLSSPGVTDTFSDTGSGTALFQEAWIKSRMSENSMINNLNDGRYSWRYGAYCCGFTAVVARYSGYDTHFDGSLSNGKYEQVVYARNHSDLWEVIEWDKNKSSLQGGDILVSSTHSWMVVEDEKGELYRAEASLNSYEFGHISKYSSSASGKTYIIRAKNANNSNVGVSVTDGVKSSSTNGTLIKAGRGNGDIGASAIELAWPEGTSEKTIEKSASSKFSKYFSGLSQSEKDSGTCYSGGKSCDRFVATSVRYSGTDDNMSFGPVPDTLDHLEKSDLWEEVKMKNSKTLNEYKSGDVLIFYRPGKTSPGHTAIYAEDSSGQGHIVQASYCEYFGVVKDTSNITSSYFDRIRVFRNKNNTIGGTGDTDCDICGGDDKTSSGDDNTGGGTLRSGGFESEEEARKAIIVPYSKYNGNPATDFGTLKCHNSRDNCSTFSLWFIKNYLGWESKVLHGYGRDIADNLYNYYHSKYPEMTKSSTPSVYSVASWNTKMPNTYSGNHTGVVVGINQSKNQIIIAEASWCSDSGSVSTYKLSDFNGKGVYVDVSKYIKGL